MDGPAVFGWLGCGGDRHRDPNRPSALVTKSMRDRQCRRSAHVSGYALVPVFNARLGTEPRGFPRALRSLRC